MDTFTISAAARLCRCDRRTLQRAIHAGRLPLDAQHCLSREALLAAGYLVIDPPHTTPQDAPQSVPQDAPHATPQETPLLLLLERLASTIADLTREIHQLHTPQTMPQAVAHGTPQDAPHEPPQDPPQDAPLRLDIYDPQTAVARIQTLRREGLSLRAIAGQLNAEGAPTRRGGPWDQSSVRHLLKTYGEG